MQRAYDHKRAFTLVEVIVAMALLALTITAAMGALSRCNVAAHHAHCLSRSVLLAERLINQVRLQPVTAYDTQQGTEEMFAWTVRVAPTPVENLGALHVQIQWLEQHRPQQYDLVSMVTLTTASEQQESDS